MVLKGGDLFGEGHFNVFSEIGSDEKSKKVVFIGRWSLYRGGLFARFYCNCIPPMACLSAPPHYWLFYTCCKGIYKCLVSLALVLWWLSMFGHIIQMFMCLGWAVKMFLSCCLCV